MKFTTIVFGLAATFAQASSSFTTHDATADTAAVVSEDQLQRKLSLDNISNNVHPDPVQRALRKKFAKNTKSKSKSKTSVPVDISNFTVRKFEGTHFYPGCGGGFYEAKIYCDYDKDLCMYEEFRAGTVYPADELGGEDVSDDSYISIGNPDSPSYFIKQSTIVDPKLICTFFGTFSASKAGKGKTNELKPIALSVSDACNDDSKAKQYVVKVASLFDRVYLSFSQDGGETYYTQDQPRMTATIATEGEGRRNLSVWSALSGAASGVVGGVIDTAISVVDTVCVALGVEVPLDDPNDPRNPDGTPVNYTNPFNSAIVPLGWLGGFAQSNVDFAFPSPDLSSIEITTNMANIDRLTRMQKAKWPEFSWEIVPGQENTRVFQTFEENISRLGYDNEGRIWSIICPQQGFRSYIGNLNVEVSVTGVRGWEDETARSTGAEMSVTGLLWFTANDSDEASPIFRFLLNLLSDLTDLPFTKSTGIQVLMNKPDTEKSLFVLQSGMDPDYNAPYFKVHWDEGAYANVYVQVQIGRIVVRAGQSQLTTDFNELVLAIGNFAFGNMLQFENVLSWNIWFDSPEIVNQTEWQQHAEKWRDSFNKEELFGEKDKGRVLKYYDGTIANPLTNDQFILDQVTLIGRFIADHFSSAQVNSQVNRMIMDESFSEIDVEEVKDTLRRHRLL